MYCNEICFNHGVKKLRPGHSGRYESGQKRCSFCEIYIIWDGRNCPCCGTALRSKPRYAKGRDKLVQSLKLKNPFPKNKFKL